MVSLMRLIYFSSILGGIKCSVAACCSSFTTGKSDLPVIFSMSSSLTKVIILTASCDRPNVVSQNLKFVCSSFIFDIKAMKR